MKSHILIIAFFLALALLGCTGLFSGKTTGFTVLKPSTWYFDGIGMGEQNSFYSSYAQVTFTNSLDQDLTLGLTGPEQASDLVVRFVNSADMSVCGWYGSVWVTDENGTVMEVTTQKGYVGLHPPYTKVEYGEITIHAGKSVTVSGLITSSGESANSNCGGNSGDGYQWEVGYPTLLDPGGNRQTNYGTISGMFR